jgi:hypothetical protein
MSAVMSAIPNTGHYLAAPAQSKIGVSMRPIGLPTGSPSRI